MALHCVLLQFGDDPFNNRYEDTDGQYAFTVTAAGYNPNAVIMLTREAAWAQRHPTIMGPSKSYFYFGPLNAPGYIVYGNNQNSIPMPHFLRQKRDGAPSKYFTAQSGKDYKWRITDQKQRMELFDGRTSLAVWELSHPEEDYHARLTIKQSALPIATEIITTLALNRMAQMLSW